MTHFKSFMGKVGALTAALLWTVNATGQNTTVLIDPVNVRQQGTISFAEFPAGQVPNLSQDVDPVSAETDDHQYRIVVDLKSIKPGDSAPLTPIYMYNRQTLQMLDCRNLS